MLKKFSLLAIVASLLIACGDDSSSSPSNEELPASSTEETVSSSESKAESSSDKVVESSCSQHEANSSSKIEDSYSSDAVVDNSSNDTAEAEDWRNYCLEVINNYRATENLKPLTLAPEAKQSCADEQSAADLASGKAHGHFGDCGEFAQNSGPNIDLKWRDTEEKIVDTYLEMMWDEKKLVESGERDPAKKEDFSYIGHYLNMSSTKYTTVACGIAKKSDGTKGWFNVNFY